MKHQKPFKQQTIKDVKEYELRKYKEPKPLRTFIATHRTTKAKAKFQYVSMNQAIYCNPFFTDWHEVIE
jgi:hypothetical protein